MGMEGWMAVIAAEIVLVVLLGIAFGKTSKTLMTVQDNRPHWISQLRQGVADLRDARRRIESIEGQMFSLESIGGVGPKWIVIRLLMKALVRHGSTHRV